MPITTVYDGGNCTGCSVRAGGDKEVDMIYDEDAHGEEVNLTLKKKNQKR